jgi:hypothetical protein
MQLSGTSTSFSDNDWLFWVFSVIIKTIRIRVFVMIIVVLLIL